MSRRTSRWEAHLTRSLSGSVTAPQAVSWIQVVGVQPDHRPHICRRHIDHLSIRWQLRRHLPCRQWLGLQIATSAFRLALELALIRVLVQTPDTSVCQSLTAIVPSRFFYSWARGRYCIASAKYAVSMRSAPARSAIVLANFNAQYLPCHSHQTANATRRRDWTSFQSPSDRRPITAITSSRGNVIRKVRNAVGTCRPADDQSCRR